MERTEYLGLSLPEFGDKADIRVIADDHQKLDIEAKRLDTELGKRLDNTHNTDKEAHKDTFALATSYRIYNSLQDLEPSLSESSSINDILKYAVQKAPCEVHFTVSPNSHETIKAPLNYYGSVRLMAYYNESIYAELFPQHTERNMCFAYGKYISSTDNIWTGWIKNASYSEKTKVSMDNLFIDTDTGTITANNCYFVDMGEQLFIHMDMDFTFTKTSGAIKYIYIKGFPFSVSELEGQGVGMVYNHNFSKVFSRSPVCLSFNSQGARVMWGEGGSMEERHITETGTTKITLSGLVIKQEV